MISRLTLFALMNLAAGTVMAAEYSLPARIRVLPVAFVPAGEKGPSETEQTLFLRHIDAARNRYRELLAGDTFELSQPTVLVIAGKRPLDFYRPPPERGAPDI